MNPHQEKPHTVPGRGQSCTGRQYRGGDTHPILPVPSPSLSHQSILHRHTSSELPAAPRPLGSPPDPLPVVFFAIAGWDVEAGSSGGISPDVLVSLSAPKQCARRFLGRQHFVAGRFLPYDVQKKFELNPPKYPGTECVVAL